MLCRVVYGHLGLDSIGEIEIPRPAPSKDVIA